MTPTDPLYASQWHFPLMGDIETIWSEFTGEGISVVVYDGGMQYTHTDLDDNYDASSHFAYLGTVYDPMPSPIASAYHGTAVAGLIAAEANGEGGVGVAFDAQITGIDLLDQLAFESIFTEYAAWRHGENFDIMNNSWGWDATFEDFLDIGDNFSTVSKMMREVENAIDDGRGGNGTVFVIAAGNGDNNANGSGILASHQTIAVAATDQNGDAEWYSNWGANILIAAPAGSVTTDLTGADGDVSGDFTTLFGGTSAATPIVSGVVALMLEANPNLGWRDVQNILALSAAQTGSAYGGPATNEETDIWRSNGSDDWNGGGATWHQSYGFGMIDAFAAVRMAETWLTVHGDARVSANEVNESKFEGLIQDIPDLGVVDAVATVTDNIEIEHIIVEVDLEHDDLNSLNLSLIAPTGEVFPLLWPAGDANQIFNNSGTFSYSFGVTGALGMYSAGDWTVRVEDLIVTSTGRFDYIDIDFYGHAVSTDDVYYYTEDFTTLAAVEGDRKRLEDTDGGTDWLNFAAFQQVVAIDLNNGKVNFDGGRQVTIVGGNIENAVSGDGDDRLFGDAEANHLMGMRGDDDLRGNHGRDLLEGGVGQDTLNGEFDRDTLLGGDGNDTLLGGRSRDRLEGGDGDDEVIGGKGHDNVRGGRGNDNLTGNENNDKLFGGRGDDTLDGGEGNDSLVGDLGADTFIFALGYEADVIQSFDDDLDMLQLNSALWGTTLTEAEVAALANTVGSDLVFDFGGGDTLTIKGLTDSSLLVDDLIII